MNTYAIPALKEKRAKIAGEINSLKRQINRHKNTLASLDATIKIFDPDYKIGSIKAIDPRKRAKMFKFGELGRHIVDALRRGARPLSTADVVAAVAVAIGEGKDSEIPLRPSVRSGLAYMQRRGKIVKIGIRENSSWALID